MTRLTLGKTGIEVADYCLGTMTYGVQTPEEDAHEQLDNHNRSGLRHGFDNGNTWHDRVSWEMTLEMGFIHRDILDAGRGLIPVNIYNFIHQQERITMWDNPLDQMNVSTFQRLAHFGLLLLLLCGQICP